MSIYVGNSKFEQHKTFPYWGIFVLRSLILPT